MQKIGLLIVILLFMGSCTLFEEKRMSGVVAEWNGHILTSEELDMVTIGLSSEDSAQVAEEYVRQWAIDLLEYNEAKGEMTPQIERLVEDYRRSLCIHDYEHRLISQKMSKHIEDSIVDNFYKQNSSRFILKETIIKGMFLILPQEAPNIEDLKKNLSGSFDEEHLEWIEKYAYQYAIGYELFLDEWRKLDEILLRLPSNEKSLQNHLKQKRQIVVEDTMNVYLLEVRDVYMRGSEMPLDYARSEIEQILLSERRVEFLQTTRQQLYENAIEQGKLKRYEK